MLKDHAQTVTLRGRMVEQTAKAWRIMFGGKLCWIPKFAAEYAGNERWLIAAEIAREKGLI